LAYEYTDEGVVVKFGLLYEIEPMRPWGPSTVADCFWDSLEQVKVAEASGFSHVFVVEHHFLDQFSVCSAPEVWLSAVAQHTSTIRIGHGSRLLPYRYNNPIRSAEMAATLDIMSKGRLEFGTARSASSVELEGFGIDPNVTRAQWDEALHMIPLMWTQDEFSWDSPSFSMPPRNVLPKPVQQPHPPLWMSGTQPSSSVTAAERGVGYMHFSISSTDGLADQVAEYKRIVKNPPHQAGLAINDQFAAFTMMFCGTDDADAMARGFEGICWYANLVEHIYAGLAGMEGATDESYQWYRERFTALGTRVREEADMRANHSMILGSPETCRREVQWYADQGVDMLLLLVQAGAIAHDDICESLRRFGSEVMPKFL
jgi:alkanesulfonate monooxygenase SsuD/methylene tetrahydromethanopterin reductase-like flavin-dependent oxidoreductase (luciferase family)